VRAQPLMVEFAAATPPARVHSRSAGTPRSARGSLPWTMVVDRSRTWTGHRPRALRALRWVG